MRVRYQSLVWITSAALCGPSLAEASDRSQDTPPPSEARRPPVITNPSWERRPIPDYPETALARRVSSGAATLDCTGLQYISSAGLGVLLKTQKRLSAAGGKLKLTGLSRHLRDVFQYSGFDRIFDIEPAEPE